MGSSRARYVGRGCTDAHGVGVTGGVGVAVGACLRFKSGVGEEEADGGKCADLQLQ